MRLEGWEDLLLMGDAVHAPFCSAGWLFEGVALRVLRDYGGGNLSPPALVRFPARGRPSRYRRDGTEGQIP